MGFVDPDNVGSTIIKKRPEETFCIGKVPDITVKESSKGIVFFRAILFNNYFQIAWKEAQMVPIPKPRVDATLRGSYRRIFLLSPFAKLFEHFLLRKINGITEERRILNAISYIDQNTTIRELAAFIIYV